MLPHRVCLNFDPWLIGLMIIGDGLTTISYLLIPFAIDRVIRDIAKLLHSSRQKQWAYFNSYFSSRTLLSTLFEASIIACGAGHLIKILVLYQVLYKLQVVVDIWTGVTSIATVVFMFIVRNSARKCAGI